MKQNHITPIYPWYNLSRVAAWRSCGEGRAVAKMLLGNRPLMGVELCEVDLSGFVEEEQTLDVIDTFLMCNNLKIVVDEKEVRDDLTLEVELEDIDDLVTEELAEIYASQGLVEEAKEIYLKLSLLNSEKSVYFAELIANLDKMEQLDR